MIDPMFITFAMALFILCMKPGPDMAAVIGRAMSDGFGSASCLIMGTITAELIYLWIVSYGFFILEDRLDLIQLVFQGIGALLFLYLGIKGLSNPNSGMISKQEKEIQEQFAVYDKSIHEFIHVEAKSTAACLPNFMTGLMVCLGNPIIILFYLSAYPAIIDITHDFKPLVVYICSFLVIIFNGGPLFVIAALAGASRKLLKNEALVKGVNLVTSFIFIGIACLIVWDLIF